MKLRLFFLCVLVSGGSGTQARGQDRFTLDQLVESALRRNANILAARQRPSEAAGLLRQAGARPSPSVEVETTNGPILGSRGEYDVTVSYFHTFERGDKRALRLAAAEPGVRLAGFEVANRERVIRAEVAGAYGDVLAAGRSLETASKLADINREYLRVVQARIDLGEAAPLEGGLLQVEFARLETERFRLESDLSRSLLQLKYAAGLPLDTKIELDGNLTPVPVGLSPASLIPRALATRPDLQAVRIEEQIRGAELQLARADAIPDVVGSIRYSHSASRFDLFGLDSNGSPAPLTDHGNALTGGLSFDLKGRNRNRGEIEAATAREQAARYRSLALTQAIEREVRAAIDRYEAARKTVAVFDSTLLVQSDQNLVAVRAAYEAGELRVFDLLSEQRRLFETQRAYVESLKESYLSRVELELALGGPLQ